jgi:hypothetical protein
VVARMLQPFRPAGRLSAQRGIQNNPEQTAASDKSCIPLPPYKTTIYRRFHAYRETGFCFLDMMDPVFLEIREIARGIVANYPRPDFYVDHASEIEASRRHFRTDESIIRLRKDMAAYLDEDFGHGIGHVEKVAIDAGSLAIIESRSAGHSEERFQRNLLLAQCAGLLHDICRKEKAHAEKGAETARHILNDYPLIPEEVTHVCTAIRNHEAFARLERLPARQARIISDCLYDADKFRWGPDNFTHTIWDMVSFLNPPLKAFVDHYPKGMALLKKIRSTFRSSAGKRYGPQFIDMGIAIGDELYRVIMAEFISPG